MSPVRDRTKLLVKVHDLRLYISDALYIKWFVSTVSYESSLKPKKHCQNDSDTEHLLSLFRIRSKCCKSEVESGPF
jgi:hypothetical protein